MLKAYFNIYSTIERKPSDFLKLLNIELCQTIKTSHFVTCVYATIDFEMMTTTVCLAGHEPIIRIKKDKCLAKNNV